MRKLFIVVSYTDGEMLFCSFYIVPLSRPTEYNYSKYHLNKLTIQKLTIRISKSEIHY